MSLFARIREKIFSKSRPIPDPIRINPCVANRGYRRIAPSAYFRKSPLAHCSELLETLHSLPLRGSKCVLLGDVSQSRPHGYIRMGKVTQR
jgi:hypothetical protein